MKKTLLLSLFLALIGTSVLMGQFVSQNSGTTQKLEDVRFLDPQTGIVIGDSGTILRTTDGGQNWTGIASPAGNSNLFRLGFFNENEGLLIGNNPSLIMRSQDAGQSWTIVADTLDSYLDLAILNDSVALISAPGSILRSADQGLNWTVHYTVPADTHIGLMSFLNDSIGFGVIKWGGFGPQSGIHKTTDGGANWQEVPLLDGYNPTVMEAIQFLSEDVGFLGGWYNAHLTKTLNGGKNWSFCTNNDTFNGGQITDLQMLNDTIGFSVGWHNLILKTVNEGVDWYWIYPPVNETTTFRGLHFIDPKNGWVVGSKGTILKTDNGGGSVSNEDIGSGPEVKVFPNPSQGRFWLEMKRPESLLSWHIYDLQGRLYQQGENIAEAIILPLSGVFILEVRSTQGRAYLKLYLQ